MLSERAFGVEIEHNLGGQWGSDTRQCHTIVEQVMPHWFVGTTPWRNRATVGADGSGVELRTPILQGERGLEELRTVMDALVAQGGNCTASDGMHVHFDSPEFVNDLRLQASLAQAWVNNEGVIEGMVAPRRIGRGACPKNINQELIDYVRGRRRSVDRGPYSPVNPPRTSFPQASRGALNLRSLARHGSIEIRLHEGTVDSNVAVAWVQFGQNFIDTVATRRRAIPTCTLGELLSTTKVEDGAALLLQAKARAGGEFDRALGYA